jgi:transketolase
MVTSSSMAYSEKHKEKFEAMGWQYIRVEDGNDLLSINKAIIKAQRKIQKDQH